MPITHPATTAMVRPLATQISPVRTPNSPISRNSATSLIIGEVHDSYRLPLPTARTLASRLQSRQRPTMTTCLRLT